MVHKQEGTEISHKVTSVMNNSHRRIHYPGTQRVGHPDVVQTMITSSNGNIFALLALCAGNSPVTGEFPAQRPVTRSFDVFFDLRLNERLSKQWRGWWFETPSRSPWRHCNEMVHKQEGTENSHKVTSVIYDSHRQIPHPGTQRIGHPDVSQTVMQSNDYLMH